jgi:hypothetical protein
MCIMLNLSLISLSFTFFFQISMDLLKRTRFLHIARGNLEEEVVIVICVTTIFYPYFPIKN